MQDRSFARVSARGVRMAFGGVEVVKGVDAELFPGEVHAIIGENGAGKSTLAKLMAGVYRPTGGAIYVQDQAASFDNPRQALAAGIALIHQEPLIFPDLTIAENIFVSHQPRRGFARAIDWPSMTRQAEELLGSLGSRLNPRELAHGLSVADQQMIELSSALSHHANVLLLDETTASLTPKEVAELFEVVRRLRDQGKAIAFVSHRLEEIFQIADRITVLRDGEKVAERLPAETNPGEIVRLIVGRDLPEPAALTGVSQGEPVLRVRSLTRKGAFEDVSFDLRPGEILGLAGLVGAGRTEVCEAIFGVVPPTSGTIEIDGQPCAIANPRAAIAHRLAMVPEDRQHHGLLLPMTIGQNATLAALKKLTNGPWLNAKREDGSAQALIARMQTAFRSLGQPVKELSGGNQQKIVLAKWLLTDPRVLILDEPTRGVDVGAKDEVHRLIRELADQGLAILMVSSDLPEVLALSDRILVMRAGRIAAELSRAEANSERVMVAATGQEIHAA